MSSNKKKVDSKNTDSILKFLINKDSSEKNDQNISIFVKNKIASQVEKSLSPSTSTIETEKADVAKTTTTTESSSLLADELNNERKKNEKLSADLKKSVALIKEISSISVTKDIEIERLTKQLQNIKICTTQPENQFTEFSAIFTNDQLKTLRSIKSGKPKDSTFILSCVRFLYPDKSVLNHISLTGKKFNKQKKEKMSTDHVEIITKMFRQRITSEGTDQLSTVKRMSNINKLIRDAITKLRPKNCQSNTKAIHSIPHQANSDTTNSYFCPPSQPLNIAIQPVNGPAIKQFQPHSIFNSNYTHTYPNQTYPYILWPPYYNFQK